MSLFALPEAVTGYALDPKRSFWNIVVPEASRNLVANPSMETGIGLYSASNGTLSQSSVAASRGSYSLLLTPTGAIAPIVYTEITSEAAGAHTFSVDIKGIPGHTYSIYITTVAGTQISPTVSFVSDGSWKRVNVSTVIDALSSVRCRVTCDDETGAPFYTDGWQFENKAYATTYFDGDCTGFAVDQNVLEFAWEGVEHGSISIRTEQTRAGGKIVNLFSELYFYTTLVQGLGLNNYELLEYSLYNGQEKYRGAFTLPREFTISGLIYGESFPLLLERRRRLIRLLNPDQTLGKQPLVLIFQPVDMYGADFGRALYINAVFVDGMGGSINNYYQESVALQFKAHSPNLSAEFDSSAELEFTEFFTHGTLVERDYTGEWTGLAAVDVLSGEQIKALIYDRIGDLYAGGTFATIETVTVGHVARYLNGAWTSMNDGVAAAASPAVNAMVSPKASYTHIYIGGHFDSDGATGMVTLRNAAYWDGALWNEMANGLNGDVNTMALAPDGKVYVGGAFTQDGPGVVDLNYVVEYDPDTDSWSAMGSSPGFDDEVNKIIVGPDGTIYAAGAFTVSGAYGIAYWNVAASDWYLVGEGFDAEVRDIAIGPDGLLYAVGLFTADGTGLKTLNAFARWNGVTWENLTDALATAGYIQFDPQGLALVTGAITLEDADLPDYVYDTVAAWAISGWLPVDFDAIVSVDALAISPSKKVALAHHNDEMDTSGFTVVNVEGNAEIHPKFVFYGPGDLVALKTWTAQAAIYFDLSLLDGEIAYLDLTPGRIKMWSNYRQNLLPYVISSASKLSQFKLLPGDNYITLFIRNTDANTHVFAQYKNQFKNLDESVL